jgi:WD repeat-containing protein 22
MFHPVEPRLILSANAKEGAGLWDVRMPKKYCWFVFENTLVYEARLKVILWFLSDPLLHRCLLQYGRQTGEQCCMSARFNSNGTQVFALRRRLPPILYSTHSCGHLFQFNHVSYYNSCTMKSCSFAGTDDRYVMSGSDNFDIHLWRIPPEGSNRECKLIKSSIHQSFPWLAY